MITIPIRNNKLPKSPRVFDVTVDEDGKIFRYDMQNIKGNTFIIVTTRPQTANLLLKVPRFNLLSLDDDKQAQFIEKNCSNSNAKKIITEAISNNNKIRRVVRTPLFLSIFIRVVSVTGKVPKSEGDLVRMFINSLFEREIHDKRNYSFDCNKACYLLRGFAYEVKEKYKSNSGVLESELVDCFSKIMHQYAFSVDSIDYLYIFLDLTATLVFRYLFTSSRTVMFFSEGSLLLSMS